MENKVLNSIKYIFLICFLNEFHEIKGKLKKLGMFM